MRIAIVEDEVLIARRLERMLRELLGTELQSLRCLSSVDDALEYLKNTSIDLLFLDLNVYGEDGFSVLEQSVAASFHTVVVSAHTEQALRAFEHGVLDFVPKPFSRERLRISLDRARGTRPVESPGATMLAVRSASSIELLALTTVVYLKGSGNYTEIVTDDGRSRLHDKTLDRLAQLLPTRFMRVHRSYIVDIERALGLQSASGGKHRLQVADLQIPVSRTHIAELRTRMSEQGQ